MARATSCPRSEASPSSRRGSTAHAASPGTHTTSGSYDSASRYDILMQLHIKYVYSKFLSIRPISIPVSNLLYSIR